MSIVRNLLDQNDPAMIDPRQYRGKVVTGCTAGATGEVQDVAATGVFVAAIEVPAGKCLILRELYLGANNIALSGINFILASGAAATLAAGAAGTRLGVFPVGSVIANITQKHIKLDNPITFDNRLGAASIFAILYTSTACAGVAAAVTEYASATLIGIME